MALLVKRGHAKSVKPLPVARSIAKFAGLIVGGTGVLAASLLVSIYAMVLCGGGLAALVLFPIVALLTAVALIFAMARLRWPWRPVVGVLLLAGCFLLLPRPSCARAYTTQADC